MGEWWVLGRIISAPTEVALYLRLPPMFMSEVSPPPNVSHAKRHHPHLGGGVGLFDRPYRHLHSRLRAVKAHLHSPTVVCLPTDWSVGNTGG